MTYKRYNQKMLVLSGKIAPEEVDPPLTEKELKEIADMRKQADDYYAKTGKHLIFDVPLGVFEDDDDQSFYNESLEDASERMKKEGTI